MKEKNASASEQKVLSILLNSQEKMTVKQILAELEKEDIIWAVRTVSTFLGRMEEKGLVGHERIGITNYYYPTVERTDYKLKEARKLLNTYFNGSVANFVSAFADSDDISDEEINELKNWVKKNR